MVLRCPVAFPVTWYRLSHLRGNSWLGNFPDQIGLWACLWGFVLIIDVRGPTPLWVAPFPGLASLGCIEKLSKQEPVSSISGFLLESYPGFPQRWIMTEKYKTYSTPTLHPSSFRSEYFIMPIEPAVQLKSRRDLSPKKATLSCMTAERTHPSSLII